MRRAPRARVRRRAEADGVALLHELGCPRLQEEGVALGHTPTPLRVISSGAGMSRPSWLYSPPWAQRTFGTDPPHAPLAPRGLSGSREPPARCEVRGK